VQQTEESCGINGRNMDAEFRDSLADSLIVLRDSRHEFLSNAVSPGEQTKVANAVFCRFLAITIVSSIDFVLAHWRSKDRTGALEPYFALPKKSRNNDRIAALLKGFSDNGFEVEEDVLQDYLAIKFMRNVIVHLGWVETEKDHVAARDFPTDLRDFRMNDFDRMTGVHNKLAIYVLQSEFSDSRDRDLAEKLARHFSE
jgi:hypothetical protein